MNDIMKNGKMKNHDSDFREMHRLYRNLMHRCSFINAGRERIKSAFLQQGLEFLAADNMVESKTKGPMGTRLSIKRPIFISARFRSGSTLLWQLFRSMEAVTAYYEPLNEHLIHHVETWSEPQQSHVGVLNYWEEYLPVLQKLKVVFRAEFGFSNLYMEKDFIWPELYKYITFLADGTENKTPVLQFNRIDLRLPWIRHHFPEATILHLYRNPRDQWFSMVKGLAEKDAISAETNTDYDLILWSLSLADHFPFLINRVETSYERHYYLWRLSRIMADRYADHSIEFENDIQQQPAATIQQLSTLVGTSASRNTHLEKKIISIKRDNCYTLKPSKWFEDIEKKCDQTLVALGLTEHLGTLPLSEIKKKNARAWQNFPCFQDYDYKKDMLQLFFQTRNSILQFVSKVSKDLETLVQASNYVGDCSKKILDVHEKSKDRKQ